MPIEKLERIYKDVTGSFVYIPMGLALTANELSHYLDGKEGNENLLGVVIGGCLLVSGVYGAIKTITGKRKYSIE
ncbi:MAG TPA: hypothetical protein ENG42_02170 [Candidatus Aenigmarchaeota archaeon]|nr:hypothetical protein [Candidatus Aenigmarchaeota archaeon]